jgi:hypothetical protein
LKNSSARKSLNVASVGTGGAQQLVSSKGTKKVLAGTNMSISGDLLVHILSFLYPVERAQSIALVCKDFAHATNFYHFWKTVDLNPFKLQLIFGTDQKDHKVLQQRAGQLQAFIAQPKFAVSKSVLQLELLPGCQLDTFLDIISLHPLRKLVARDVDLSNAPEVFSERANSNFNLHYLEELFLSYDTARRRHNPVLAQSGSFLSTAILNNCMHSLRALTLPCWEPYVLHFVEVLPELKFFSVTHRECWSKRAGCQLTHVYPHELVTNPNQTRPLEVMDLVFELENALVIGEDTFLRTMSSFPSIRELSIGCEGLGSLHGSVISRHLSNIRKLSLAFPMTSTASLDLGLLAELEFLEELHLRRIESPTMRRPEHEVTLHFRTTSVFASLSVLYLSNMSLSSTTLVRIIQCCPQGLALTMAFIEMEELHLCEVNTLQTLSLEYMDTNRVTIRNCAELEEIAIFESSILTHVQILDNSALESVHILLDLFLLESLSISGENITLLDIFFRRDNDGSISLHEWWKGIIVPNLESLFVVSGDHQHIGLTPTARSYFASMSPLASICTSY